MEDLEDLVIQEDTLSFVFISFLRVCQEWGILYGGTCRTLKVSDWILGPEGHL